MPVGLESPLEISVLTKPLALSSFTTRLLPVSATVTSPSASTAIPWGALRPVNAVSVETAPLEAVHFLTKLAPASAT